MGKKKKQDPADVYRPQMEQAAATASTVSPEEQQVRDYTNKLWDMYTGKTKFDLSEMPNAGMMTSLYEGAKAQSDRGRIGKGLQYGGAPGTQGYNPNLIASIDQQNQNEREQNAAGQLEQQVADTFSGIGGKMSALGAQDQNERDNNFNRYAEMYGMEINRPKQPKWWESLLGGVASGVASGVSYGSKGWAI